MSISIDTATDVVINNNTAGGSSTSYSVNNNANRVLVLMVKFNAGSFNTLSYNGVACTNIVGNIWYLIAPATGSNTLAWTGTSLSGVYISIYSVIGASQTAANYQSGDASSSSNSVSEVLNTNIANMWGFGLIRSVNSVPYTPSGNGMAANGLLNPGGNGNMAATTSAPIAISTNVTFAFSTGSTGGSNAISGLLIPELEPILFPSVFDTITITELVNIAKVWLFSVFDSVSHTESVTMETGVITFNDFAIGNIVTSFYKWITSTLLTAQQNYNVQPYFQCKILDDTVQPNAILKNGSSGGTTALPNALGEAITAPDGSLIAAGFDASNHISFFKAANMHANGGSWDTQVTLDSSASILIPHSQQGRVAITCSDYINGSYHIDVYYFSNFVNDGTDLQIVQQFSDDGGVTWSSRTFNLGVANNLYYASSPSLFLSLCGFKPRLNSSNLVQSGFAFTRGNGNSFASNPNQAQKGYDIYYVTGTSAGFSSNIQWSQKNVDSNDWIIHSLDSFYLNGVDYIVFSGFRNFIDAPNTLGTNHSIWITAGLVLSGTRANDLWSAPRAIFSSNSVSAVNQNSFTYPVATVTNGVVNIVFRAVTVATVSQSAQGASSTVVTTSVNYMMTQTLDAINFTYPTIIVFTDGTQFNDDNRAQTYNSYTNQGVYFYIIGSGLMWEFIQNNIVADVSNDVVQYSIQETAGQPSALNIQIADQNNMWYPAGTNPGASAIAKNRKILIQQGFYNANGVPETVPRNTFYIDDITQNVSSNSNNVVITARDLYKKLKTTVTKYAFGWLGPFLYSDIFDGSTIANWSQVSGNWVESNNTITTTVAPVTDAVLLLNGITVISWGSVMYVNMKRNVSGTNHIYAMYIDSDNWLRLEIADATWAVVRNVSGSKTTLDSGAHPASGSNTYSFMVRRYDYFKFNFFQGTTGTNNAIDTFSGVQIMANGTGGEYDLTAVMDTYQAQPFGVGFGYQNSGAANGIFSFFKFMQFDNSNSLADLLKALGTKAGVNAYDIQDVLTDQFDHPANYTGTFTTPNNTLLLAAGNTAMNNIAANEVSNGEFSFKAKLTPTSGASAYGFKFVFRSVSTSSSPNAAYYWHVMATASGGYIHSRFEVVFGGVTYIIPAQSSEVTSNPVTNIGNLNFDLTAIHTFKLVAVDGWMFAFIDGIMVNAWNDNNTTTSFLTTGFWGWSADSNTALTVYSMNSTAFWKQIQQFSLNPGDDVESGILNLLGNVRAWMFSNLMGTLKALFLSSVDPSTYTYQNQIFAQGVDSSDKEYVSQVTVYGDGVSAVARNTTLMAGVAVREEVIVDYTIKTQQDAQTRANNELTNSNQYQNQYNPKQTMNVGAEVFDSVTVVDTGNNSSGVNGGSRVYAQKFTVGGSGGGNEYSEEIDTGNL